MPALIYQQRNDSQNHGLSAVNQQPQNSVLEDNREPRFLQTQLLQREVNEAIIQRFMNDEEIVELRLFFDRQIRQIGSPISEKNRALFQLASEQDTLITAKAMITEYVQSIKDFIDIQSADPIEVEEIHDSIPLDEQDIPDQHYTFKNLKRLGLDDRMSKIKELSDLFAMTEYEQARLDNAEQPDNLVPYYRYHKFPRDSTSTEMVTGGFFNKSMLSSDETGDNFHNGTVRKILKERSQSFGVLSGDENTLADKQKKVKRMEKFQASARNTPFIATTADWNYAASLFQGYPPEPGQIASILTILGPAGNVFDFESEFERLAVGLPENNYRTTPHRAKDAGQAEYGIPDLFIPMTGVSRLGFRIVDARMLDNIKTELSADNILMTSYFSSLTKIDLSGLKFNQQIIGMMLQILRSGAFSSLQTIYIAEGSLSMRALEALSQYVNVVIK